MNCCHLDVEYVLFIAKRILLVGSSFGGGRVDRKISSKALKLFSTANRKKNNVKKLNLENKNKVDLTMLKQGRRNKLNVCFGLSKTITF